MKNVRLGLIAALFTLAPVSLPANAQQVLPRPEAKFTGKIGRYWEDSEPGKMPVIKAPAGAPNILFVLIDDAGYGQAGTFGGAIPTPTLDRLAEGGLRYTQYHTTALCSPTRAALLTGRNHHSVGTGVVTELATSYPGYTGSIPKSAAMVSEILRQNGYNTAAFGKWHNTPDWETSASGPYDRWPTMQGFEKFYGFMGGESGQWQPALYDGVNPIELEIPKGREGHYTLNDALADKAIEWINEQKSVTPNRPFFVYYAPGATHAPHHVPKEWIEKFKGKFDQGWDKYREETFERQKKLGVIPADAKLTPRPKEIPAWDSLSAEQKRIACRLMETFAGYTAQTDHEVGRLLDALKQIGQLDNTLVFYEMGDNGASAEGSPSGVFNEMAVLNGVKEDPSYLIAHLDEIGGPQAYNHYPVGWAWAMDTPFQWTKQISSHFGGTRNPLVVFYPQKIHDKGTIRTQFHHCIDIVPTILEVAGIQQPTMVNGVAQKPIEGVSMAYTFDDPKAESKRHTQYFEMFGTRALYHDGWIAATRHNKVPWENQPPSNFNNDKWELYNVNNDFSEATDLSEQNPEKLKALQDLFWVEAAKFSVLPLDDRFVGRLDPTTRPSLIAGRTSFTYLPGVVRIPESSAANVKNRSHTIEADVVVPEHGAEGVLAAAGGVVGGWTLYVKDNRPIYEYNYLTVDRYKVASSETLSPGPATIKFDFDYEGIAPGRGGIGKLFVNGRKVGEGKIDKTIPGRYSADETFDTGMDTGSPVGSYASPFPFTGTLKAIKIQTAQEQLTEDAQRAVESVRKTIMRVSE
ncbi:MAG: arylsulfatase [Candidatus Melainabacteria bacterium]|nr:MAG: arylsulfatase [Candidatus Melainabacteria bacterium]